MIHRTISGLALFVLATRGLSSEPMQSKPADRIKAEWCKVSIKDGHLHRSVIERVSETRIKRVIRDGKEEMIPYTVVLPKVRSVSWDYSLHEIMVLDCGERLDSSLLPTLLKEPRRALVVRGSNVDLEILKPIQHLVLVLPAPESK